MPITSSEIHGKRFFRSYKKIEFVLILYQKFWILGEIFAMHIEHLRYIFFAMKL